MSEPNRLKLEWRPPGAVAAAYFADRSTVSLINGPVGSGKTTASLMKLIRLAREQRTAERRTLPGPDGQPWPVRMFRVTVVRDTYRQLWKTTIPSWWTRVPKSVGVWGGSDGDPATHEVQFRLPDRTIVEFKADFVAIGDQAVEDVLRGYETTAFYLNETDLCAEEVLDYALTRLGRYPPMDEGGPTWTGILGDMNAPELNSWAYRRFFRQTREQLAGQATALFRQPSGLAVTAENLANLPPGYYQRMAQTAPEWVVRRMIENVPGHSRAGKPVYPEFNDNLHVADVPFAPGLPLLLGLDAGGHPAAVLGQKLPSGRWHILHELVGEPGTGAARFGNDLANLLRDQYSAASDVEGWVDPSAAYGADTKAGEKTWIEVVAAQAAISLRAAPTNRPLARWEAVRAPLARLIDGRPGFLLHPRCTTLRAGFNAEYRFRKVQGTERYDEQAEKNDASHPHDALQYLCSGGGEDQAIRARRGEAQRRGGGLPRFTRPWDPYQQEQHA